MKGTSMSDALNLNTPLSPPQGVTADLVLTPPAAVPVVETEQAAGLVPVAKETASAIEAKAAAFVADLVSIDVRSPEFGQKISAIMSMGEREVRESSQVSNRLLDRPAAALDGARGRGGNAQARVAGTLAELRHTVADLDPGQADLRGARKVFKFLPGGDKLRAYFDRYQSAQQHLDSIIRSLDSGKDELRKDNAAIEAERANMWSLMGKLSEYVTLAAALDRATEAQVASLQAAGRVEDANTLTSDALFPIRQRRQDILTQLAVAVQGYLALDLVKKNNVGAAHRGDRGSGAGQPAPRSGPDQRAQRHHQFGDRRHVGDAAPAGGRGAAAGFRLVGECGRAAAGVRQHLRHDGRDRHLQGAGREHDGRHRGRPGAADRAGPSLPGTLAG
jgi:exonuclease VII small subunit